MEVAQEVNKENNHVRKKGSENRKETVPESDSHYTISHRNQVISIPQIIRVLCHHLPSI